MSDLDYKPITTDYSSEFRTELEFDTYNGMPLTYEQMQQAIEANWIHPAFRDGIITVDKLLDHVDVVLDWYIPSVYAIDFMNFIRLVLGEEPENANPKAHYFLIDCIFRSDNVRPYFQVRNIDFEFLNNRIVVLCTREFSKSTLLGTMLVLYMAAKGELPGFGRVNYVLYVADSMRNNVKTTMETIGSVYMESEYLRGIFESATTNQDEVSFVRKPVTKKEIALYDEYVNKQGLKPSEVPGRAKRTFSMKGLGASTGGRGSRDGLFRPDIAIFDDMVSSESDATSDVVLQNIESTIESDVLKALSGNGNFAILIGTPYNKKDPVYRRVENKQWLPIVFPKAERISEDLKEEDFRGVWPDRHTYKQCINDYIKAKMSQNAGDPSPMRSLMQEYYLRISNDEDRLIPDTLIQWFSRQDIIAKAYSYNWYVTTDFTTTGNKGSDFSCIMLWAVDSHQNHFLIDMTLKKLEVEEQYNETFAIAMQTSGRTRWVEVGVEIDGQQSLHILGLKDRMPKKNFFFSFARQKGAKPGAPEGIRSRLEGGNKHWRFRMTLPLWQNRKIWFAKELKNTPDMKELLDEIKYTTYSGFGTKHDDGVDGISQLTMIDIQYPAPNLSEFYDSGSDKNNKNSLGYRMWNDYNDDEEESDIYDSYI